jgi:hypothetical protein
MAAEQNTWPEFNGAQAISFPRGNGTEYILFGEDASNATSEAVVNNRCDRLTRIIHQKIGGQAILCGTYVQPSERGAGLGEKLIDYFMENAPEVSGEFGGTGLVHKPVFAAQLGRLGLYPIDTDFFVGIPRKNKKQTAASDVPDIIVLNDSVAEQDRWRIKSHAGRRHQFYNVVGEPGWGERPIGPMPKTYLHTRFTPLTS